MGRSRKAAPCEPEGRWTPDDVQKLFSPKKVKTGAAHAAAETVVDSPTPSSSTGCPSQLESPKARGVTDEKVGVENLVDVDYHDTMLNAPGIDEMIRDVDSQKPLLAKLEKRVGQKLGDDTVRLFSKAMQTNAAVALEQSPVSTTPTLSAMEEKAAKTYKEAIDSGKLKPKSYLGNKFRKAIKGSPEFDRYQAMDRDEGKEFRLEWAKRVRQDRCQEDLHKKVGSVSIAIAAFTNLLAALC